MSNNNIVDNVMQWIYLMCFIYINSSDYENKIEWYDCTSSVAFDFVDRAWN